MATSEGVEFMYWEGIIGGVLAIALKWRGSGNE
jgi:hypothetical protein